MKFTSMFRPPPTPFVQDTPFENNVWWPMAQAMPDMHMIEPWHWEKDLDALRMLSLGTPKLKRKNQLEREPRNYRIVCECPGYSRDCIKAEYDKEHHWLVVSGRQRHPLGKDEDQEYTMSEFRRKFELPDNVNMEKMSHWLTRTGQFVVEMPFITPPASEEDDMQDDEWTVRIVDNKETGGQEARLHITLPLKKIDPSKVEVSVKDRDVIVKIKDHHFSFLRRSTMPMGTEMDHIKCELDTKWANRLVLHAPFKHPEALEHHGGHEHGWKNVHFHEPPKKLEHHAHDKDKDCEKVEEKGGLRSRKNSRTDL